MQLPKRKVGIITVDGSDCIDLKKARLTCVAIVSSFYLLISKSRVVGTPTAQGFRIDRRTWRPQKCAPSGTTLAPTTGDSESWIGTLRWLESRVWPQRPLEWPFRHPANAKVVLALFISIPFFLFSLFYLTPGSMHISPWRGTSNVLRHYAQTRQRREHAFTPVEEICTQPCVLRRCVVATPTSGSREGDKAGSESKEPLTAGYPTGVVNRTPRGIPMLKEYGPLFAIQKDFSLLYFKRQSWDGGSLLLKWGMVQGAEACDKDSRRRSKLNRRGGIEQAHRTRRKAFFVAQSSRVPGNNTALVFIFITDHATDSSTASFWPSRKFFPYSNKWPEISSPVKRSAEGKTDTEIGPRFRFQTRWK